VRFVRRFLRALSLVGTLVALTGCLSSALQRLPLEDQAQLALYKKVMTPAQVRTYLAQGSAAERTAYLQASGLVQRFEALAPLDRDAVRNGFPRVGMSAEALRFVWGDPYETAGDATRYAHWRYLGSSLDLTAYGNQYRKSGNRVDVSLVDGHIVGWVEYIPRGAGR
jgi:hypothetical protein